MKKEYRAEPEKEKTMVFSAHSTKHDCYCFVFTNGDEALGAEMALRAVGRSLPTASAVEVQLLQRFRVQDEYIIVFYTGVMPKPFEGLEGWARNEIEFSTAPVSRRAV